MRLLRVSAKGNRVTGAWLPSFFAYYSDTVLLSSFNYQGYEREQAKQALSFRV